MSMSIRNTKKFEKALEKLKLSQKHLKSAFKMQEISELTSFESTYKNVFRSKLSTGNKINRLLDLLLRSSAYMERLTNIRNEIIFQSVSFNRLMKQMIRQLRKHKDFNDYSKKDQESLMQIELGEFLDFDYKIKSYLNIVENSLDYLNKLHYNIKAVIGPLKGKSKGDWTS